MKVQCYTGQEPPTFGPNTLWWACLQEPTVLLVIMVVNIAQLRRKKTLQYMSIISLIVAGSVRVSSFTYWAQSPLSGSWSWTDWHGTRRSTRAATAPALSHCLQYKGFVHHYIYTRNMIHWNPEIPVFRTVMTTLKVPYVTPLLAIFHNPAKWWYLHQVI